MASESIELTLQKHDRKHHHSRRRRHHHRRGKEKGETSKNRHHHRSRKEKDETSKKFKKIEVEETRLGDDGGDEVVLPKGLDCDMEEGEIVGKKDMIMSDAESGEKIVDTDREIESTLHKYDHNVILEGKYNTVESTSLTESFSGKRKGAVTHLKEDSDGSNGSSKSNPEERDRKLLKREEDDTHRQDDQYQEKILLQLAQQEQYDDDLEKIMEESRKRKQAIIEKCKNQQHNEARQSSETEPVESTETTFSVEKSPLRNGLSHLDEGTPKSERVFDMFSDDLFGESPTRVRKGESVAIEKNQLADNWDDGEGYYGYHLGEILDGRYEVVAAHGKGVFSTVVRAKDLKAELGDPEEEVAIKIIRNNETMYKAGMQELLILKKLVGADPEDKGHCVRLISTFRYRNHLCLVFQSLYMNLREIVKKFGRDIGLKLTAVRAYAEQLFIALKHLKNCGVLHSDIKPDNMLVNESKNVLKLSDFGSAMFAGEKEIAPNFGSRFYRAPEIILGLPYDHPADMWSVGCCLFELYAGKVLFPGSTNNNMLHLHMELSGPVPKKMLRKGAFVHYYFDQDLNFITTEETTRRLLINTKPKDLGKMIVGSSPGEDPRMVDNFKDLMKRILILDPDKRLTVSQALKHPFITGK